MSYILDALRKADADRERDAADALLGTPGPAANAAAPTASARAPAVPVWRWLAAGAAIPLVALLAWRWATPDTPEPVVAAVTSAASATVTVPAAAQPASAAVSAPMAATDAASAADAEEPAAPASTPRVAPAPPGPPKPAAPKPATRKPPAPKPPVVAAAAPPPARAEAKPSPAAAPVRALAELPEDLRRQVPAMTIGGSVYSPQPASRMLIVNGQVMREGATLAPGLQLESIGRQSAIFSIRGQRFEMKL